MKTDIKTQLIAKARHIEQCSDAGDETVPMSLANDIAALIRAAYPQGVYCVECGGETELDCVCDDLNHEVGQ